MASTPDDDMRLFREEQRRIEEASDAYASALGPFLVEAVTLDNAIGNWLVLLFADPDSPEADQMIDVFLDRVAAGTKLDMLRHAVRLLEVETAEMKAVFVGAQRVIEFRNLVAHQHPTFDSSTPANVIYRSGSKTPRFSFDEVTELTILAYNLKVRLAGIFGAITIARRSARRGQ